MVYTKGANPAHGRLDHLNRIFFLVGIGSVLVAIVAVEQLPMVLRVCCLIFGLAVAGIGMFSAAKFKR
jgi:hypothetical protein